MTKLLIGLAALALAAAAAVAVANATVKGQTGLKDGRLQPCPDKPNCVGSQETDAKRRVDSIAYEVSQEEILAKVKRVAAGFPRVRLIEERDNYLHFAFTSAICRFVDDVEFLIEDSQKRIHVRSASRVGYSDLGVNRRRVEEIKRRLQG